MCTGINQIYPLLQPNKHKIDSVKDRVDFVKDAPDPRLGSNTKKLRKPLLIKAYN